MTTENLDQYEAAYGDSFTFHEENLAMLDWYVDRLIESNQERRVRSLLSLGIGHQVVSRKLVSTHLDSLERYVIVEGSEQILTRFSESIEASPKLRLEHGRFESYSSPESFDSIEMGFVLEHVDDPALVVTRYKGMLADAGRMFVAVPNALSLHRRIGHKAGLLDDLYGLSPADLELGHKRYFDLESISTLLQDCGLSIQRTVGIYLKPFSTQQLSSLNFSPAVLASLYNVGRDLPDLANSILIEASL